MKKLALIKVEPSPLALADMNVDQLGASYEMLDRIASEHDNANTVCRLLQGLVLTEAKRKLPHGEFGKWLKGNFPKSQDTAGRCMRASEDFIQKLSRGKFRSTAEFDPRTAVDLLRNDLKATLERLSKVRLDLAHPLVRAAQIYAKGRSFYQLCLDLGPADRGGNQYDRSKKGRGLTGITAAPIQEQAEEILWPAWISFQKQWRRGLWLGLAAAKLQRLDGDLIDLRRQIKKSLEKS
jgi:hypothetical protein